MINLDSVLKSRDIILLTKVCLVKAMVFPVVRYGCESWTTKKAEHGRIDAFELWCWRRLLRVPWTARRSSQSILNEISLECSLEGLILKLKLQYFGHLMWRADSLEKDPEWERLKARGEGDDRGWGGWMASLTRWTWVWVSARSWWWTRRPGVLRFMGSQRVRHDWATEQQQIGWESIQSSTLRCENKDTVDWGWVCQWKEKWHGLSWCSMLASLPQGQSWQKTGSNMTWGQVTEGWKRTIVQKCHQETKRKTLPWYYQ